jgi:hypothetical protein
MRREDPWEFEHSQVRLGRHERWWVECIREDGLPDEDGPMPDFVPPIEVVVCPQCGGRGRSSMYLGAFSAEEMWEDPDFAEDYMRGGYDRECESCHGRNVVERIDEHALAYDPKLYRSYVKWMRDAYDSDAIQRQEWMMGA